MKKIRLLLAILIVIPFSFGMMKKEEVNLEGVNPISFKIVSNGNINKNITLIDNELKIFYDRGEEAIIIFNSSEIVGTFEVNKYTNSRITFEFESSYLYAGSLSVVDGGNYEENIDIIDLNQMVIDFSDVANNNIKIYKGNTTYLDFSFYNSEATFKFKINRYKRAVIEGETSIINSIDNPYSLDQIKDKLGLVAYDDYFGDITKDIIITNDTYSNNMNVIGTFELEFSVTNEAEFTSTCVILIHNKDLTSPIITGPKTKEICYSSSNNLNDFIEYFTFTDNIDKDMKIEISSEDFVPKKVGTFNIHISCIDLSGNEATYTFDLIVVDKIIPYFEDESLGKIEINYKQEINDELILGGLKAIDEVDGIITSSIKVVKNDLKALLGKYEVIYEVSDKSGNNVRYSREFTVISKDEPIFWVSKNLLLIEDIYKLSIEQLVDLLATYEKVLVKSYEIIEDEYSDNYNIVGKYEIEILMTDSKDDLYNIQRTIEVFNVNKEVVNDRKEVNELMIYATVLLIGTVLVITIIQTSRRRAK